MVMEGRSWSSGHIRSTCYIVLKEYVTDSTSRKDKQGITLNAHTRYGKGEIAPKGANTQDRGEVCSMMCGGNRSMFYGLEKYVSAHNTLHPNSNPKLG